MCSCIFSTNQLVKQDLFSLLVLLSILCLCLDYRMALYFAAVYFSEWHAIPGEALFV